MPENESKKQQVLALEAQIRDQRRLGGPTSALERSRSKLLTSMRKAASEAQRRAHADLLQEERWNQEHYHRRET